MAFLGRATRKAATLPRGFEVIPQLMQHSSRQGTRIHPFRQPEITKCDTMVVSEVQVEMMLISESALLPLWCRMDSTPACHGKEPIATLASDEQDGSSLSSRHSPGLLKV